MIKKIYIAGPLFNKHEQMYLEDIAKELEGNGYDAFFHTETKQVLMSLNLRVQTCHKRPKIEYLKMILMH